MLLVLPTAALLGLGVFAIFVTPDPRGYGTHESLGLPPCFPLEFWNVPCPGCGVTTSVALVAHGCIGRAFVTQPFGALLALAVPFAFAWAWIQHFRGRDLRRELMKAPAGWLGIGVAVIVLGAWVYKLAVVRGWLG